MASKKFKCPYCGKEFTRERTLQVHMCEPKRRYLQKDEKWVVNAFMVFQRFYQIHQKNTNFTLKAFSDSPFPVSLSSMMWEGYYSPRYYRRA